MTVVDLDYLETWPSSLVALIRRLREALEREVEADLAWEFSKEKWFTSPPAKPARDEIRSLVAAGMAERGMRLFHATRLLDDHDLATNGVRALDYDQHGERVAHALARAGFASEAEELRQELARHREGGEFRYGRERLAWTTAMRSTLHDPSLTGVFYEKFGGEVIDRLASPGVRAALSTMGVPRVVILEVPPDYLTAAADFDELARVMCRLVNNREDQIFDVKFTDAIPADFVVDIVALDEPAVRLPDVGD